MKFNHPFSNLRLAAAGLLISAAAATLFFSVKPFDQTALRTSTVKSSTIDRNMVSPLLRLRSQEKRANVQSGALGPRYDLFTCQVGLSLGACYDAYQIRRAYSIEPLLRAGYNGSGQTIVIVDAFQNPNLVAQVALFNNFYGLPRISLTQYAPDGLTDFIPGDPNMTGWAEEISLDVEWAHAIAPAAHIALVLAKSNSDADILSALKFAVDQNLGTIISMSFGEDESCIDPALLAGYRSVFIEATRKNITLFASSGDFGAAQATCNGLSWEKAVSYPASDPLVTSVGGTELRAADYCLPELGCDPNTHPVPGTYESEIVWNEGAFGDFQDIFSNTLATGGGFSIIFPEPPYQQGTIHGGKRRGVPDVAFNAAILHGVLTYLEIPGVDTGFYRFGGTSAGAPQWSAIAAITNQKAQDQLGFLNAAIYRIGKNKKLYPLSFHDITVGNNSALEFDANNNPLTISGFFAGVGWDPTTGFGSPIATNLVDYLIQKVSPGDERAAIATTKTKRHPKPLFPGKMRPH